MMTKHSILFTFLFTILGILIPTTYGYAQSIKGETFSEAKATKKANFNLVYIETEGFSEREGNNVKGICADIMNDFSNFINKKYGIKIDTKIHHRPENYSFNNFLTEVSSSKGSVFGLGNITITEERKEFLSFSPPILENFSLIITHAAVANLSNIKNISSVFGNMRATTSKGTTNEATILSIKQNYYPSLKIEYEPSQAEILKKIINDKRTFTDMDFAYFLGALKDKLPVKMHTAKSGISEYFGIIFPKNSGWEAPFEEFLTEEYRNSNECRKIITDHLGANALNLLDSFKKNRIAENSK